MGTTQNEAAKKLYEPDDGVNVDGRVKKKREKEKEEEEHADDEQEEETKREYTRTPYK